MLRPNECYTRHMWYWSLFRRRWQILVSFTESSVVHLHCNFPRPVNYLACRSIAMAERIFKTIVLPVIIGISKQVIRQCQCHKAFYFHCLRHAFQIILFGVVIVTFPDPLGSFVVPIAARPLGCSWMSPAAGLGVVGEVRGRVFALLWNHYRDIFFDFWA